MSTFTGTGPREQRDRLHALRKRASDAKEAGVRAKRALDQAKADGDQQAADVALDEMETAAREHQVARDLERRMLSQLTGADDQAGMTIVNSAEAMETLRAIAASSAPLANYVRLPAEYMSAEEVCGWTGRALATADGVPLMPQLYGLTTVPAGTPPGTFVGLQRTPQAPLTLLDVFASVPVGGSKASWLVRQGGVANAGVQVPGDVKASADVAYTEAEGDVVVVATWSKVNRVDLDDFPSVQGDLQQALVYGLRHEVESLLVAAILGSTGLGAPDFTGFTPSNARDQVAIAAAELRATGVTPNFAAWHPLDRVATEIERGSSTSGDYVGGVPGEPPVVLSSAIARGTVLLGDSNLGAKIGVRAGVSVAVGQEADDMTRNRVTLLIETRIVPMVTVPVAFSEVTLA